MSIVPCLEHLLSLYLGLAWLYSQVRWPHTVAAWLPIASNLQLSISEIASLIDLAEVLGLILIGTARITPTPKLITGHLRISSILIG